MRVLVVDDKEENLYYLSALLSGHGFTVDVARHGAEALVMARKTPPDLVISDLLMPVMDGYTLLRHWKADVRLKQIPFVVYTATYTEAEDERLALNLGADAFIVKPMEPEDFLGRIRDVQAKLAATVPAPPRAPISDEKTLLKVYSETLIRKLEEKTLQLEETNATLQQDIAERRRVEEELRESEERFRATFEQAAVGIAHVSVDGKFLRVNDKLCEITGYAREELLQRTFADLTVAEDRSLDNEAHRAVLAGEQKSYSLEKRYQRKDRRTFWVSIVTKLLRDGAGGPKYFITVITDITERKVMQEQFLRAQRMESIGALAGGIAHDLNNLLSPIMMGVQLLRMQNPHPDSLRLIQMMEQSAQRGTNLVKQVLSFARGIEGARVTVHLGHLVREIQEFVQSTFPKNIVFKAMAPKNTWLVLGDPTQLNQVLLNLCVNARDAMPQGGTLGLTTSNVNVDEQYAAMLRSVRPGRYVLLEISDTGTGIAADVREHIFEPFYTTKEPGKGTGLGLSTVLTIVRGHGGAVDVVSEVGRGTTFKVFLPAQPEARVDAAAEDALPRLPRGHGELVLAVDDDAAVRGMIQCTLEAFGYRVITAEDGAQAVGVYAMRRAEVAVVLTDLVMPVMDGPALVKAFRRINPEIAIVVSSGHQGIDDPDIAVEHVLVKPYTAEAMLTVIDRALRDSRDRPRV